MPDLDDDQQAYLRTKLGSEPPEDLQAIYDRLGDVVAVAREVLETRLADLLAQPEQFNVAGEYGQSTGRNIDALTAALAELGVSEEEPDAGGSVVRIVNAARHPRR